jgi:hypothetical protein
MTKYCSECGSRLSKPSSGTTSPKRATPAPKRQASAYSAKYAKAFKSVASKHKKKNGSWKKDGYKRAVKAAHAKAKRMR